VLFVGPKNVGGESEGSVEHGEWLNLGHEIWSRDYWIMARVAMIFWDPIVCGTKLAPVHVSTMLLGLRVDQYFVLLKAFCMIFCFCFKVLIRVVKSINKVKVCKMK